MSYTNSSQSSSRLSTGLGALRLRHENSRYRQREGDVIINWGYTGNLLDNFSGILNRPQLVRVVSNKLRFFERVTQWNQAEVEANKVNIPEYTTDRAEAVEWLSSREVLCRTVLNGHSGEGIVVARDESDLVDAPLYVKYIPKKMEFRVHCMNGEVFDVARKIRDPNREVSDYYIRNHSAGFIFARNDITVPECVTEQALLAMRASGLDFGAVDVIYNERQNKAYVLEINSAPGLEGATLTNYINKFKEVIGE